MAPLAGSFSSEREGEEGEEGEEEDIANKTMPEGSGGIENA